MKKGLLNLGLCLLLGGCSGSPSPVVSPYAGDGTALLSINESPNFDYGTQLIEAQIDHTFTVTNGGRAAATAVGGTFSSSAFLYKGGHFPGTGGTCGTSIPALSQCQIVVTFSPQYAATFSEFLRVDYFNGIMNSGTADPNIQGQGATFTSGLPDITFNNGGAETWASGAGLDHARAVVVQSDRKIVVAGYGFHNGQSDFTVVRLLPDGSLDTGFGIGGSVILDFAGQDDFAMALAIQSDGKILLAGSSRNGSARFALARFTTVGALDNSFGTSGLVTTSFAGGDAFINDITLQLDGRIVVGGYAFNGSHFDFAAARYQAGGTLDLSFGTGGKVTVPVGANDDYAQAVRLQVDGKVLLIGYASNGTNDDMAVARLTVDGILDTSYGTSGVSLIDFGGTDRASTAAIQVDGRLVIAGAGGASPSVAVARLNADGSLNGSFGSSGKATFAQSGASEARGVYVNVDGTIILSGSVASGIESDLLIMRLQSNGSLSPTFGTAGKTVISFGANITTDFAMATQANGKYVLVGDYNHSSQTDFALIRIWN